MGIKTESITWDMKTIAVNKLFVFTAFLLMTTLFASCNEAPRHSLPCLERAVFGDPNQSPYILPFSVDESFRLIQGYCYSHGGHRNQLAYDFETSIGVPVLAARAGRVMKIRGDLPDDGKQSDPGQHNHIMIKHDDGTVAFYAHLKQNSIVIKVDEHVSQGQPIAQSGNSGNTQGLPHLHFGVYQDWPAQGGFNVAVNFRNAEGTLGHRGGLRPGGYFRALPY